MFSPQVLECSRHTSFPIDTRAHARIVKDYEFDLHLCGDCSLILDGAEYPIAENTVTFRRPGQRCSSFGQYDCWCLSLNFSIPIPAKRYTRHRPGAPQPESPLPFLSTLPSVFLPRHPAELKTQFQTLHSHLLSGSTDALSPTLLDLFFTLLSDGFHSILPVTPLKNDRITESILWMEQHLREPITVESLATRSYLSPNHYSFLFRNQTGSSPIHYLIQLRMTRARELLTQTDSPLSEIASECGYPDLSFFIRAFRQMHGEPPTSYRKTHRK